MKNIMKDKENKMQAENKTETKTMTRIAAAALAVCTAAGMVLTGCGSTGSDAGEADGDTAQHVALVMGVHKYFPAVSLEDIDVYDSIYDAAYTYGSLTVIEADGDPYVAVNDTFEEPDANIDKQKRTQLAEENADLYVLIAVGEAAAKTEEVDTLEAISMAADALESEEGSVKTLYIVDSGLSTTGYLDFASQDLIDEPAESIVEQLKERCAIPDLSGVAVIWTGLGQTCGEQTDLTEEYQKKLEDIWTAVLEAGGAESVKIDPEPLTGEETDGDLPDCSTVAVVTDSLEVSAEELPEVIKLDETTSVQFVADQAEFIDADSAREELEPVADYLAANPDESICLFGMTATTTNDDSDGVALSLARAETCKEALTELGADAAQIQTAGLGELDNPLRVDDTDADGNQVEELAQKNRAVLIVQADSDIAETLLACQNV